MAIGDFNPNGKKMMKALRNKHPIEAEVEKRAIFTRLYKVKEETRTGQPDEVYTRQVKQMSVQARQYHISDHLALRVEIEALTIEKPDLYYTKKAVQSVMRDRDFLQQFIEGDYPISNPKHLVVERAKPTKHTARLQYTLKGSETKEETDAAIEESRKILKQELQAQIEEIELKINNESLYEIVNRM